MNKYILEYFDDIYTAKAVIDEYANKGYAIDKITSHAGGLVVLFKEEEEPQIESCTNNGLTYAVVTLETGELPVDTFARVKCGLTFDEAKKEMNNIIEDKKRETNVDDVCVKKISKYITLIEYGDVDYVLVQIVPCDKKTNIINF